MYKDRAMITCQPIVYLGEKPSNFLSGTLQLVRLRTGQPKRSGIKFIFAGPIADVVAREKTKVSKMTGRRMKGVSLLSLKRPAAWKISE